MFLKLRLFFSPEGRSTVKASGVEKYLRNAEKEDLEYFYELLLELTGRSAGPGTESDEQDGGSGH